jgi:hypothetical protein
MSQRNGDRARFQRNRKKKLLRRLRNRLLVKSTPKSQPAVEPMTAAIA